MHSALNKKEKAEIDEEEGGKRRGREIPQSIPRKREEICTILLIAS